ncbi:MAG: 3-deoxy-7-phosphoheptulonate synthase [Pontiellaceae bacterium]
MNNQLHITENLRIRGLQKLATPSELKNQFPLTEELVNQIIKNREIIRNIIHKADKRMLVVIGPCSIHDTNAAYDYAKRLSLLSNKVKDKYLIVMRVYFEKPRTTTGWKGFINDPHINDSCDMEYGLKEARKLLIEISELGLPMATEFLDPIIPQYIADLISWAAIGARTTESQTHREMASGLSMPVGFKNGTDGNIQVAINAISSASIPHSFLGIDQDGQTSVVKTEGNPNTHLVLRGGEKNPNFKSPEVKDALDKLLKANINSALMIDCSHANANKISSNQINVWNDIIEQRNLGNNSIIGAMIESFIEPENKKIIGEERYGLSITDPCISWSDTERMLLG